MQRSWAQQQNLAAGHGLVESWELPDVVLVHGGGCFIAVFATMKACHC